MMFKLTCRIKDVLDCSHRLRDEETRIRIPNELLVGLEFHSVIRHNGQGDWRVVPEKELIDERMQHRRDEEEDLSK